MTLEQDLTKLEGKIYPIEVRLNAADGAVDTENYEVYGAAEAGRIRVAFDVKTTEEKGVYHVEVPALSFLKNPYWDYQLCARRKTTGHEWLLMQGRISLRYRIADVPEVKIGAPQQTFTATISSDLLSVDVHEIAGAKGDRGYSAYEIACQHGYEGTEEEWLESIRQQTATLAVEQVQPLMVCAENAAASAEESAIQADARATEAEGHAAQAAINATDAAQSAKDAAAEYERAVQMAQSAAGSAAEAQERVTEAQASAEVADEKARDAESSANEAFGYAAQAAAGAAGAQVDATNAANSASQAKASATSADSSKTQAAASATQAATSEANAAKSASAAEESAAQLGDAALKSGDNTFTGNNIFSGAINGVPAWMQEDMLSTMYRDMVLTEDEIKTLIPADVETWADYPVPNGDYKNVYIDDSYWKKVKRVFCKFPTSPWYQATLRKKSWGGFDEAVYFLTEKEQHINGFVLYAKKATLLAPKLNYSKDGYGPVYLRLLAYTEDVTVYAPVCQNRLEMNMNDYTASVPTLKSITVLGVNVHSVVRIVVKSPNQVLKTRAGFPKATNITISDMELNKESVLPILNNLLTYDSATMTAVPTLTICIHTDLQADEEVQSALALASTAVEDGGKGWQVTTQWNGTATASTFALRPTPAPPVYVKATPDEQGGYVDATNTRFSIDWGHMVSSPDGKEPEELGYTLFDSLEAALTEWGLTEYTEIQEEQEE